MNRGHRPLPFARKVHQRMQERGLGLREFCRAVGLDPSFFSKVLSGKRSPPSNEADLRRIAEILQLDAPSLIVAAGRIPSEWEKLWHDHALFEQVHHLAAGKEAPRVGCNSFRAVPGAYPRQAPAHARYQPSAEDAGKRSAVRSAARSFGNWGRGSLEVRSRAKKDLGEELL